MSSLASPQTYDIVITHFVNPHEFWYKHDTNTINEKLYDLETRIQAYFLNQQRGTNFNSIRYIPKINETVAVLNLSENRWIRAVVDHVYEFHNEDDKYILWAIDHGKPLMSSVKYIRQIPDACANYDIDAVFFGGLNNVLPAEKNFDFLANSSKINVTNKWSEKSIKICEEIINRSFTCTFHIENDYKRQRLGQLEITTDMNKKLNIKDVLIEINDGISRFENFNQILDEYQLNKSPRWLQPNGNCNLFKFNHNIHNMQQRTMPPLQLMNLNESETVDKRNPSMFLQKKYNSTLFVNNIENPISIENQVEVNEKIENWNEKNDQQSGTKNYNTSDCSPSYDNLDSISNIDISESIENQNIKNELLPEKMKQNYEKVAEKQIGKENLMKLSNIEENDKSQRRIGRTHDIPNLTEKLKMCQPPRENDPTIVPDFQLTEDNILTEDVAQKIVDTTTTLSTYDDDKKSIASNETDLSAVKLKRLLQIKKRYNKGLPKQQIEQSKAILIPAGYDLRNLNTKTVGDNKILPSSTNLVDTCKKDNRSTTTGNANNRPSSSMHAGRVVPANLNQQKKIHNSPITYAEPSRSSNDLVDKNRKTQQRIKVDCTLHNVNEVCIPTSSIGKDSVLVHGEIPKPIDKMIEAKFTSDIHREMERLGINKIYRTQQYAWPHLSRLNSLILVNSKKTGKTYSYLPIICSLINMQKDDGEISDGVGPIGIIIVPFRSDGGKLLQLCRRFTKKNVLCTGERYKSEAIADLQSNADLLICTPEGINLLMNNDINCFSRDRMKHLIIENLNLWNEQNREILKETFKRFQSNVQIVVTSQIWDATMEKLLTSKSLNNPLLCIGAHIEAAIYAKINFKLKIIPKIRKIQIISDFINKYNSRGEKLIILCNNDEDVEDVSINLRNLGHFVQSCTNRLHADDIREITQWNNNSNRENFILITSDENLVQLQIQNAQNLIHYTLSTSWSRNSYRFSVFLKFYSDRIKDTVNNQHQANTLILLDEDNNDHLPKLVNFLERNNSQINPSIKKLAKKIEIAREKQKNSQNLPLCDQWLEYGKIHDKTNCRKRHLITCDDAPANDLPRRGIAEIQIISCESPVHYCVRLIKHKFNSNHNWQLSRESNQYVKFNFEFTKYFSNSDNHQLYYPFSCNDLCVVKEHEKFDRGRIIEITKKEIVYVKLIDRGQVKAVKTDKLLYLPDKFKEFPPQVVDLYLTNVIPYDEEEIWDKKDTETIKNWLEKYKNNHRIITYINFSLSDIIFADEIVIQEYLGSLKAYNNKLCIKKNIIQKEFVKKIEHDDIYFSEISISAKKLFHKSEIQLNEKVEPINDFSNNENIFSDKSKSLTISNSSISSSSSGEITMQMMKYPVHRARPRHQARLKTKNSYENIGSERIVENSTAKESWNVLKENEFSEISVGCFYSPNNFYVEILHDVEKLGLLYKKISDFIANGAKSVINPVIGFNCLAKTDGNYNRCKIASLKCDSNGMFANVFFCDIGSNKNCEIRELRTTNSEIVSFIPYQAIHCSLIGITSKNIDGSWTDNDSENIYDIIDTHALYARPMINAKQNDDHILNYWKYDIILVNCSSNEDVQVNKQIIKLGYAIKDSCTEHYLDFSYNKQYSNAKDDNENSDDEDWKDDPNAKQFQFNSLDTQNENDIYDDNNLDNWDINLTDELLDLLNLPPSAKILPPDNDKTTEEPNNFKPIVENNKTETIKKSKTKMELKNIKENQNDNEEIVEFNQMNDMPKLISLYKIPMVIWQQSEELICLKISTPDITDYNLYVTNSILIFTAVIDGELNVLNLNLYGLIDETVVCHEKRGLNVIVRLLKRITGKRFTWPRLTKETDKHNWLKYNYDAIIMEHDNSENLVKTEPCIEYTSDTDSELEENYDYETYTKIDNPESVFDILQDN